MPSGVFSLNARAFLGTAITGTGGTGGTELKGVDNEDITVIFGQRSITEYLNNHKSSWRDVDTECLIVMDLLEMTALVLKLLFPGMTDDGITFGDRLGTKIGHEHALYNLLLIPQDAAFTSWLLFAKSVSAHIESGDEWIWSPGRPVLDSTRLVLQVSGDEADTEPSWRMGTAAVIAAAYAAVS